MTTKADIFSRAARRIGGRTGTVLSGTTTTAVLGGLVGVTNDETAEANNLLIFPAAEEETDKQRLITTWEPATGTATIATTVSPSGLEYIVSEEGDYTLAEYRAAWDDMERHTKRTYRLAVPMVSGIMTYPMYLMDWLEGAGDIDGIWQSTSPDTLHNSEFAYWQDGAALAPDGWTLAGDDATVARAEGFGYGSYAATVTRVGNDATLTQSMYRPLVQYLTRVPPSPWTVRTGAWVTCSVASRARLGISDVSTTTWSEYHTGSGVPEYLHTSLAVTDTMTDLQSVLSVDTGDTSATFQRASLYQSTALDKQLRDYGTRAYPEYPVQPRALRNEGGIPTVTLGRNYRSSGQLVVYSRRPIPPAPNEASTVDDQYARASEAGLLRFLLEASKKNQDRTRLDRVMNEEARVWTRAMETFIDLPVPVPPYQYVVTGA